MGVKTHNPAEYYLTTYTVPTSLKLYKATTSFGEWYISAKTFKKALKKLKKTELDSLIKIELINEDIK